MNYRSSHALLSMGKLKELISRGLFRSGTPVRETFELKVHLACDQESGRWYVAESDIPGLWLEADDPASLMTRVQQAAPELIELNMEEIVSACRARDVTKPKSVDVRKLRPSLLPVFDSPLALAHA